MEQIYSYIRNIEYRIRPKTLDKDLSWVSCSCFEKLALMKAAAIGMRIHSGWGALVVLTGDAPDVAVLDRRRIVITDPQIPGAKQPYHFAAEMEPSESE